MSASSSSSKQGVKVLVTGSILQLFLGVIYVWSVFVKPVSEFWKWDVDAVKLTSSFMLAFFVLGILIGGRLQNKLGTHFMVLGGGLLMAVGMVSTSLLSSAAAWPIYITYGIVGGFGVGMAYNAIISCAQKWFPTKRGLATGISVCMFGFSTVIFAPLIEYLIRQFSLLTTLQILGGAFLVVTLALFSFIRTPEETTQTGGAAGSSVQQKQYTTVEMLKNPSFYLISLSMMLLTASFFILTPSLKSLPTELGYGSNIGTFIVMLTGIASALGRLAVPLLGDKIGPAKAVFTILAATAVCMAGLCINNSIVFIVAVAVVAFCYGGSSGIYPVVTGRFFGLKNIGSNYGMVMIGFMLSSLCFPQVINLITNNTVKFITLAGVAAFGAVIAIALIMLEKRKGTK